MVIDGDVGESEDDRIDEVIVEALGGAEKEIVDDVKFGTCAELADVVVDVWNRDK
jgi:hypothetical protein